MQPPRSLLSVLCVLASAAGLPAATTTVNWLDQKPPGIETGVAFGVPWPRGAVPAAPSGTTLGGAAD